MGRSRPDGDSTWVCRHHRQSNAVLLINPCSGRTWRGSDDACPLISVGMLADGSNCWANVQVQSEPWRCSYDVTNPRDWAPLWAASSPPPLLPPFQPPIIYTRPDPAMVEELEDDLLDRLKADMGDWRRARTHRTDFRRDLSDRLRPLLDDLETRARSFGVPLGLGDGGDGAALAADAERRHKDYLSALLSRYRVVGCPLNLPFRDVKEVSRALQAAGVHRTEDERVEFALGCKVVAYPNFVLSVWLYALALTPA
jgi:hypothetical protein